MPDHFRPQVDAMGPPRSPASSDFPLSLVIFKKDHHDHRHHHHGHQEPILTIHMPGSPSRSSGGYSEPDENPGHDVVMADADVDVDGSNLVVAGEEIVQEEAPLSLVVEKSPEAVVQPDLNLDNDDYGGGEPDHKGDDVNQQQQQVHPKIKIKNFAKFEAENAEAIQIPPEILRCEQTRAALLAPRKSKTSESEELRDDISTLSSDDTWATDSGTDIGGGARVYSCHHCDKVFSNRHHLTSHLVTHTGERNFSCRKCGKCFGRKSTLRAHMTTHTGTSNFMCPLCDKACNDNNSLEEHIRMHTGEKPFVCSICSKAYARKSHLNVHYRVHTGERPFVCLDCGKDFTEKRFLNDHAQTAHNGQDGPLKCPNCFREFAYKTSLKQHLKKQMCVKNLNRGQGGQGHGAHAKQFACPFCDKSYSWKQTLKQHVSMYHRNKVHTDEFWKYELSKHRRTVMDNETNEDMWQRQLGKHATGSETASNAPPSASLLHEIDPNHEDKWLDQIKRSSDVSDMKLLALRSLQSSLQFMSNPGAGFRFQPEQQQSQMKEPKHEEFVPTREDGYLAMLANVSFSRMEGNSNSSKDWTQQAPAQQQLKASSAPNWEVLKDMQEEPAAKRTQMWLAQLGQYKQKEYQEELDRSHDELWEEQIARAKLSNSSSNNNSNVRSSIEAVEITIDDEDEEAKAVEKKARPPRLLPMMMSALQVHPAPPPPPPPALSPIASRGPSPQRVTLMLHNSEGESQGSSPPRRVPAFYSDESNNNNNNNIVVHRHVPLATPPLPQRSLPIPIPRSHNNINNHHSNNSSSCNNSLKSEISTKSFPASGQTDSVLKSLLLESTSRKRPISPPPAPAVKSPAEETDILRRRLLGLPDLEPVAKPVSKQVTSRFSPPSATITSKDAERQLRATTPLLLTAAFNGQQNFIESLRNSLNKSDQGRLDDVIVPRLHDDQIEKNETTMTTTPGAYKTTYKTTSVLKHLLHRYTADATDNNKKEI